MTFFFPIGNTSRFLLISREREQLEQPQIKYPLPTYKMIANFFQSAIAFLFFAPQAVSVPMPDICGGNTARARDITRV
jgi:hypothetical protein